MNRKKSIFTVRWLGLALAGVLLLASLGACTIPKGGGTSGPPT
jgi:hypothetical protein